MSPKECRPPKAAPRVRPRLSCLPPVSFPIPPSLIDSPHLLPTSAFRNYHALSELHDPRNTTHDELCLMDTVVLGPLTASPPSPAPAVLKPPLRQRSKSDGHAYGLSWARRGPFTPASGVTEADIAEYFGHGAAGNAKEGVSDGGVKSPSTECGTDESSGGSSTGV